eukprot:jgi/Mesvir1/18953/Mv18921-RA.2
MTDLMLYSYITQAARPVYIKMVQITCISRQILLSTRCEPILLLRGPRGSLQGFFGKEVRLSSNISLRKPLLAQLRCILTVCTAQPAPADKRIQPSTSTPKQKIVQPKFAKAKKSLGQNFLTSTDITRKIVQTADVRQGDLVLEIGPGRGMLTRALAATGAQVVAVEKDDALAEFLTGQFEGQENVEIIHADILRWPVESSIIERLHALQGTPGASSRAKVVANIPYNLTTELLKGLLPLGDSVSLLVLMLQEEAAVRLTQGAPGDADYRTMNLWVKYFSDAAIQFLVNRTCYSPQPNVDSAVVTLRLKDAQARLPLPQREPAGSAGAARSSSAAKPHAPFFQMVQRAFLGRRKMLRNTLQTPEVPSEAIMAALEASGIKATVGDGGAAERKF